MPDRSLIIGCGALARELQQVRVANDWSHVDLVCLDASLHNRPEEIPGRLRAKLDELRAHYDRVFVAYADCGTNGGIDRVLENEPGVARLPGPHCFATFTGEETFNSLMENEPGTFWLTDFLTRHFETMVVKPLKLDSHPELRDAYFGNYSRLTYISQVEDADLLTSAREAASYLDLNFSHYHVGMDGIEQPLKWCSP